MKLIDPCKQSKCITYPICINKRTINCNIYNTYVEKLLVSKLLSNTEGINIKETIRLSERQNREFWNKLHNIFPKIHPYFEEGKYPLHFSYEYQDRILKKYRDDVKLKASHSNHIDTYTWDTYKVDHFIDKFYYTNKSEDDI